MDLNKTVLLGTEYDEALFDQLLLVIEKMGGIREDVTTGMGGSQEMLLLSVRLKGGIVTIERETYVGLSIHGPVATIDEICMQMDSTR
ncbi:MAG: hypothetical protein F9K24_22925 [Leptonema illini]|jgi:hypothetical protein|uniref:Uncharacterized protein n=1 Tax=Leptonema illini TaxID=183 RepID=A0A833GUN8_9LEPT|nr:MAG: hypothetical protein F9K24_22925 [Leptonema illini]